MDWNNTEYIAQCFILSEGGIYIYFMSTCKYQLPRMLTYDTRNWGTSHSHIFYTISSMPFVNDGYDALKTMLLAVYSHFVDTLIFIFFHLFHSFSLAINYLYITCKGFHYRRKFARNDAYWLVEKHFCILTIWINVWFTTSQFILVR